MNKLISINRPLAYVDVVFYFSNGKKPLTGFICDNGVFYCHTQAKGRPEIVDDDVDICCVDVNKLLSLVMMLLMNDDCLFINAPLLYGNHIVF